MADFVSSAGHFELQALLAQPGLVVQRQQPLKILLLVKLYLLSSLGAVAWNQGPRPRQVIWALSILLYCFDFFALVQMRVLPTKLHEHAHKGKKFEEVFDQNEFKVYKCFQ